ncbi:Nitrogen permease regulator 2 [Macrophomina phaseolina MS6]|uniref:Nitrogen permease regulator 2 n=1 Tax=Macrophomina phaseolina (strain MS6) TaxID=1126212 RepID=K2S047_MACPH|nr:Nitrogen permease regulator 2 [Macrophomina phaseolina MS6]
MIKGIFYTRFHPEKGSRVLHQVPDGSITPSSAPCAQSAPYFSFSEVSEYVIPRQEFCDRLVTVCANHYRIIGYPVCINNYEGKYDRNQFIFNFALVVEEDLLDWNSYASVVRKLGKLLRNLEEQGSFLSKEEKDIPWDALGDPGRTSSVGLGIKRVERAASVAESVSESQSVRSLGLDGLSLDEPTEVGMSSKVYALCEMILEDLNNYCECMIPIDDSNTINLKLFPTRLPPAPVNAWHVPLLTIDLEMYTAPTAMNPHSFSNRCATLSSDLTLTRILPYIDGINSVSFISQLADTDLGLTRKAIQHLVYYDCVVLLDIFQFGAMYAPTPFIAHFFTDEAALAECARYVRIPRFLDASMGGESILPEELRRDSHKPPHGHARKASIGSTLGTSNTTTAAGSPTQTSFLQNRPHRSSTMGTHSSTAPTFATTNLVLAPNQPVVGADTLIQLYSSMRQGVTLRAWVLENSTLLTHIDVRRLVTFGVIKGFLYRVHKYAITTSAGALAGTTASYDGYDHLHGARWRGHNGYNSPWRVDSDAEDGARGDVEAATGGGSGGGGGYGRELPLARYLDGLHCFDEVCTELGMSEREVLAKMKKGFGDVLVVNR